MRGVRGQRITLSVIAMCFLVVGCSTLGARPAPPVDVVGAGGLTPTQKDPDAGRIEIRNGFDVKSYPIVLVATFPVTDADAKGKDEAKLTLAMPVFFQTEIVKRLRLANVFTRVEPLGGSEALPAGERVLKLEGRITRLAAGDDTSMWVPFSAYGRLADRMKAQIETSLVDGETGQVMVVTADRRESPNPGDQSAEKYVQDSFEAMARDLVRFLERLARGEAPAK